MKRALSIILALICLLSVAITAFAAASFEDVSNSVVRICAEEYITVVDANDGTVYTKSEPTDVASIGSGFAVGKKGEAVKYFITNSHVITAEPSYESDVQLSVNGRNIVRDIIIYYEYKPYLIFSDYDHKLAANVTAVSDRCDLAVLSLNDTTTERTPITIKSFNGFKDLNHQAVYAVGFPGIADTLNDISTVGNRSLNSYLPDVTVTKGIVGNLKEHAISQEGEMIQHDAKLSGGNSGGPLVDEKGYLLGVNKGGLTEDVGSISSDYSLAISANELIRFLKANEIAYQAAPAFDMMLIIIIAAAVVIILVVVIVMVSKKSSAKKARSLYCDEGGLKGHKYILKNKTAIGHDPKRCQIVFPESAPGVSGLHCSVYFDGKQVTVVDENSRYGTWIDSQRLQPGVATIMHRGQKLYLGSTKQAFSLHN